ncbi:hypothetical protein G4B88_024336 [Cannabis sativa]|uniref:Uncharacterized protein n=1 Tax=Cannabis sativa TaxID=3483 RepID=A0A7J6H6X9_CANSA|nr:hypothetical protein G4B88_024336 [Cannabis sativa]
MNLKEIVLRSNLYGTRETSICVKGPGYVTAQDIILPSSIPLPYEFILNRDLLAQLYPNFAKGATPFFTLNWTFKEILEEIPLKKPLITLRPLPWEEEEVVDSQLLPIKSNVNYAKNLGMLLLTVFINLIKASQNSEGQPLHDFSSDASPRIQAPTITVAPQKTQITVSHSVSVLTSSVGPLTEPMPTSVAPAVPIVARTTPIVPSELPS